MHYAAVSQDEMVKQQAVIAGASEVRRILQGGNASRPPPMPAANVAPPPDRMPGFVSGASQTMQAPVQMPHSMPTQPGQFVPQSGAPPPMQQMAQTVPLYVGVESLPDFDLHSRLRGPGVLLHCITSMTSWIVCCLAVTAVTTIIIIIFITLFSTCARVWVAHALSRQAGVFTKAR